MIQSGLKEQNAYSVERSRQIRVTIVGIDGSPVAILDQAFDVRKSNIVDIESVPGRVIIVTISRVIRPTGETAQPCSINAVPGVITLSRMTALTSYHEC